MSKTIDQRVVEMRFDNANFEKNVSTSMSTLDKLKKSLKFEDSAKGFENISKAAGRVDMGGLAGGVESVRLKFSALEVMAVTALTNITNSALNAGKKIASALTIEPIKTGLQEYETQINATQTILANTQKEGANINDVNRALNELNKYADLTIYNFTEMTRNIGTFTAAGVDLNTSVNAIKGIANLAAVSGSTSQQASTAMYQLSQALASGTVKLQDWNSVVNANMGGQVFQDALKMTARVHGIAIDEMIADEGSFRETLSKGWLTKDILTETLQHFTEFTDTYNEESLKRQGYNDKEIAEIKQMGVTATDAATKIKTFTQLWDVLKESAQSGWTTSWQTIIGDFEEAKETLTVFGDTLTKLIGDSADARNAVLKEGFMSGWKQLLNEGIEDTEGFQTAIMEAGKNSGVAVDDLIKKYGSFEKSLKGGWVTSDMLKTALDSMADSVTGLSKAELEAKGYTEDQRQALINLCNAVKDGTINLDDFAKKMGRASGRENMIDAITMAFEKLMPIVNQVGDAFQEVFNPNNDLGQRIYDMTVRIKDFVSGIDVSEKSLQNFKMTFKGAFALVDIAKQGLNALGEIFGHLLQKILPVGDGILGVTGGIGEWIVSMDEAIKSGDGLTKFVETVNGAIDALADGIGTAKDYIVDLIKSWTGIDSLQDLLSRVSAGTSNLLSGVIEHTGSFSDVLSSAGTVVSKVVGGIWNSLKAVFSWISDNISIGDIFAGLAGGGIFVAAKKFSGLIDKIKESLSKLFGEKENGVKGKFADVMDSIHDTLSSFQDGIKVSSIVGIAVAVGILSASIKAIADLDVGQITKSLVAVGIMLGMLSSTMKRISKTLSGLGSTGLLKAGASLILIAGAINILAGAMKKVADLSLGEIAKSLIALGGGLTILVIGLKKVENTDVSLSSSVAILALAISCNILASALQKFGDMSWDEIGRGLVGMGGALAELVAAISVLSKFSDGKSLLGAISIIAISLVLGKIANALKKFGDMSWDEIQRGLTSMGYALAELTAVIAVLNSVGGGKSLVGTISIVAIVLSLNKLANALKKFGDMSWDEIGRGLAGMGGALAEVAGITGALGTLAGVSSLFGAGAIFIAIQGLADLADAFKKFGDMSWGEIAQGLVGMGGALLEVSIITGALGAIAGLPALLGGGAILLAVQSLGDLADAFKKFGEMPWDEIGRGLSAMGGALGELALGGVLNTLSGLGALSISTVAEPLGTLADSVKKWTGVTVPEGLGLKLAGLAAAISSFTFSGIGATSLAIAAEPVGILAESVKKWTGVTIPDGLADKMATLATGIEKFTFAGLGAGALSNAAPGVGDMADAVKKWSAITIPDNLETDLNQIASGVKSFSFAFVGGWSLSAITGPIGDLADSIKKWKSVSVPDDLGDGLERLSSGMKSFTFAFVGGWSLTAIVEPLTDLADAVKKWNGISVQSDIGTSLKSLADGVIAFSWSFIGGWTLDAVAGPLGALADSVKRWKNISVPKGLGVDLGKLANGVSKFSGIPNISISANGLESIATATKKLSDVNYSNITDGLHGITESVNELATIDSLSASLTKFGEDIVNKIIAPVQKATAQFKTAGSSLVDALANGVHSKQSMLVAKVTSVMSALINLLASKKSEFTRAGSELTAQLVNGIGSQASTISSKFSALLGNAVASIRGYYGQFQSAGSYLAAGVANGIAANSGSVANASANMAAKASTSARSKLKIHSPSKVGYQIGDYFGIGFTNGISDNIRKAGLSSEHLAESARAGLTTAISKVADFLNSDMDTTPTIRPVLDLTEIQNGAVAMSALMNSLSGRPVQGTVGLAVKTANTMNQSSDSSKTVTVKPSDSVKASATTNNFYITGTDPRAIADEVDRKLQRRVERRNAAWA